MDRTKESNNLLIITNASVIMIYKVPALSFMQFSQ